MVHHIILLFFCGIICSLKGSYGAKSSPRVVIVGAGVAGISAGVSLVDKGFEDVTILEAENRIGGRVHTVPFGPHTVDMGAHWVHGQEGNSVYEISNPLGLVRVDDFSALESTFVVNDGRELNTSVASELNELAFSLLEDSDNLRSENGSLRDYIMNRFRPIAEKKLQNEPLLQAFMKMEDGLNCLSNGCDKLSDVSASGAALYEQHGDNNCWSKGGYQNIIDLLLNQHPAVPGKKNPLKGKIELNCEVSNISWAGAEAVVKCLDGRSFMADHVIVTVSLGVLKAQHSTLFSPQLPNDKIVAIKNMGFGAIGKVFLRFDKEWEYGNQHYIFILRLENSTSQSKEYAWHDEFYGIFPESCVPSVNTIWLAGDATRQMENRTEEQVLNEVSQTLNKLLGKKYNLPRIQSILRSKWYSNPHFRGSYSYITESAQKLNATNEALARPLTNSLQKQILLFAGEATHSRFYSTVHGALDSGRREAKRIAEMYQQIVS